MREYCDLAAKLRKELHRIPEPSMQETGTKKHLITFLKEHSDLEVIDCGQWFYAGWTVPDAVRSVAIRADFDAVTGGDGVSRHLCGHDGHAAILAAFGVWISQHRPAENIFLIFQPGEESGEGAKLCREIIKKERIQEIYAFHNIPGKPAGEILLKQGTFACASTGLEITLSGKTTHAAYPENGINPAGAAAQLILDIEAFAAAPHEGMVLSTVIGIELGSASYGVAASSGVLRLTVRAEYYREFLQFLDYIRRQVQSAAQEGGLQAKIREIETFPSTENAPEAVERLRVCAEKQNLDIAMLTEPMRWSEDFGWYLREIPGAMFGVGAGEMWPPLHTESYEFNDEIIETVLRMYRGLL